LSQWRRLLGRTIDGLDYLQKKGKATPDWVLGGGTALMLHTGHRFSQDIDAFITDPQYLAMLSPRLGGEDAWACDAYTEAANHLKLVYPEGEIDFIVATPITDLAPESMAIAEEQKLAATQIDVEHPVEIALKKLVYRAGSLKVRDIFDIAVVDSIDHEPLRANLHRASGVKRDVLKRLASLSEDYCRQELAELDIQDDWQPIAGECLVRTRKIVESIPDPKS
jgi:nucleotidyltransferase AbiEii toxin of type IV toxin-antitoxin system